jgi:hypothetical protein
MPTAARKNHDALWEERAQYGLGRRRAKDRWFFHHLLATGSITAAEHAAAERFSVLIERSFGQAGARTMDRVDSSSSDPHARIMDAILAGQLVESAVRFVIGPIAPIAEYRKQWMAHLFGSPRLTTTQAYKLFGRTMAPRIAKACAELLCVYFDTCDKDRAKWNAAAATDRLRDHAQIVM